MSDRHDNQAFDRGDYLPPAARVGSTFYAPAPRRPGTPGRIRGWLLAIAIGAAIGAVLAGWNLA